MRDDPEKDKQYEAIFKTYYKQLFHYALQWVNDTECAADITNDVFCYFWEKYDQLDFTTSPLSLLYTLIRNNCVDYLRHKEVEQKNRSKLEKLDWQSRPIQEVMEREARINRLMAGIQQLPPQTHKVFEECFLKGRKYKEVAEELGISINTVKTYIVRALQYLRENHADFY